MAKVTRQRWRLCLTPSTYCSRAFRPLPDSCTSRGRLTLLTFLAGCPLCVEMGPMLWTQIDSRLLMRGSWQRFARATGRWSSPLLRSWGTQNTSFCVVLVRASPLGSPAGYGRPACKGAG